MESLATLGYAAYGCGIRYRYGMFKQQISDGFQVEVPDNWLKNGYPFELRRPEYSYEIKFGGYVRTEDMGNGNTKFIHEGYQSVMAIPYDMPIVGYDNHMVNTLMIWDAEPKEGFQLDSFDKGDYNKAVEQENLARNLVEVLYPNDNHIQGKELRLKQQYFFVSASLQRAIARFKKHHEDIHQLPEKAVFQMNDTHPTVAVAELMRILLDEEGLSWRMRGISQPTVLLIPTIPLWLRLSKNGRSRFSRDCFRVYIRSWKRSTAVLFYRSRSSIRATMIKLQKWQFYMMVR